MAHCGYRHKSRIRKNRNEIYNYPWEFVDPYGGFHLAATYPEIVAEMVRWYTFPA